MKVYSITNGHVEEGVKVDGYQLLNGNIIPAVLIGEKGRGRKLGVLSCWSTEVGKTIRYAAVGKTLKGNPCLEPNCDLQQNSDKVIIVLRTIIGFRGSNDHTGDVCGLRCQACKAEDKCDFYSVPEKCPKCGSGDVKILYDKFPCEIVIDGVIAQGDAGRMGSGDQYVVVARKGTIFRTAYFGRLYGSPSQHFYKVCDDKIIALTKDERKASEMF